MAIDTAEKRKSISGINYIGGPGVTPNSSQDQEWRQEVGYGYSGILAGVAAIPPVIENVIPYILFIDQEKTFTLEM